MLKCWKDTLYFLVFFFSFSGNVQRTHGCSASETRIERWLERLDGWSRRQSRFENLGRRFGKGFEVEAGTWRATSSKHNRGRRCRWKSLRHSAEVSQSTFEMFINLKLTWSVIDDRHDRSFFVILSINWARIKLGWQTFKPSL